MLNFNTYQTPSFDCCTACSFPVVDAYLRGGAEFVRRACAEDGAAFLESLSGVSALTRGIDDLDVDGMFLDDDDDDDEDEGDSVEEI
jgi:hypothetical protein